MCLLCLLVPKSESGVAPPLWLTSFGGESTSLQMIEPAELCWLSEAQVTYLKSFLPSLLHAS